MTFVDDELTAIQAIVGSAAGYAKGLDGSLPDVTAEILASVVARVVVHQDSVDASALFGTRLLKAHAGYE